MSASRQVRAFLHRVRGLASHHRGPRGHAAPPATGDAVVVRGAGRAQPSQLVVVSIRRLDNRGNDSDDDDDDDYGGDDDDDEA
jgi:hypothetical protein